MTTSISNIRNEFMGLMVYENLYFMIFGENWIFLWKLEAIFVRTNLSYIQFEFK